MKKFLFGIVLLLLGAASVVWFLFPEVLLDLGRKSERGAAGLTEQSVQVGEHEIAYLEGAAANDKETVLMVHGFAADKDNWTRFAPFLSAEYHLVAPDLPGHGQSSRIESASYDIRSQVERLHAFANALGLERFHILGNSMGGHIAGVYAASYPEQVITVGFFNNAGIVSPKPSELQQALVAGSNPLLVDSVDDYDRLMNFVFVNPPAVPRPVMKYFAEQAVLHRAFNEKIFADLMEPKRSAMLEPLLPKIKQPVLILWGDTDRLLDVSTVSVMEKLLPNATSVIMNNMGHAPMIERPADTATHYVNFLLGASQ